MRLVGDGDGWGGDGGIGHALPWKLYKNVVKNT